MAFSYNYVIVLVASFGSLTFGFSNSVMGSVLGFDSFNQYFEFTNALLGATSGLFFGGSAIGALIHTWLADYGGRVQAARATAVICIVGGAIQAGAVHVVMFMLGRFLAGVRVGLCVTLVPVYQSEIVPPAVRGFMVGSYGMLIVTVALHARCPMLASIMPPPLHGLYARVPEMAHRPRQARQALRIIRRFHVDSHNPDNDGLARAEFSQMRTQIAQDHLVAEKSGTFAIFTMVSLRKRLAFGCLIMFLSQSTGILVINNYQVLLYNGLGLSGSIPLLLYAVYLTWAAFMNWVSAMIMDQVGRVRLLSGGLFICSICLAVEAAMVARFGRTTNAVGNGFGVFFLFFFVGFYAVSIDATVYVYATEIFPTHLRAQGMGLCIVAQSLTSLLHTQVAPTAFETIGWRYYLVFVFVPLSGVLVIWHWFPETKGLALEEIAAAFGDDVLIGVSDHTEIGGNPDDKASCGHSKETVSGEKV